MAVWRLGVTVYATGCARRIAEMAPRSPLALPSRPDRQGSVQLHAHRRGVSRSHHLTTLQSRRTLTRGPARSLAMPKHEDVRERTNLVHLLGEDIDELQPSDPMHASLDRKHSQGD